MSDRPHTDTRERSNTDTSDRALDPDSVPGSSADGPTFDAPWQARAFSLAVALTDEADENDEDDLSWTEFQSRLVAEVDAGSDDDRTGVPGDGSDAEAVYYRQWLAALERLLVERGVIDSGDLRDRVESFESGARDAHEFVDGDPHEHADALPEGHADGADHDHGHDDGHNHDHAH